MQSNGYEKFNSIISARISSLDGIGQKRADAFSRLGIYTLGDLLHHFPRAYQNRGNIRMLKEGVGGENSAYLLTIGTSPKTVTVKNRMTLTKFTAFDESGTVVITYFNSRFTEKIFKVGETYRFWGKVSLEKSRMTMSSPAHELYFEGAPLPDFIPIYPSASGLSQRLISEAVNAVIDKLESTEIPSLLPEELYGELSLPSFFSALEKIHTPTSFSDIENARRYFSAEQLYIFALGVSMTKNKKAVGIPPKMEIVNTDRFFASLGFEPTNAQRRSIAEIYGDMTEGEAPMARLLSGDVGSGKTAVAAAALYLALSNGYQAALMAPTEILASQHASSLIGMFENFGYTCAFLCGSTTASEKRRIKEGLKNGSIKLLIGTHALITSDVEFSDLGLVITDEQHRFGVSQRATLGKNNRSGLVPHVLVMSATPIPRTLALILYGELKISVLDELPPGRQRVDTFVVDENYRGRLNGFIAKQIQSGGQVYIVCPRVESESEEEPSEDTETLSNENIIGFAPDGSCETMQERGTLKSATELAEHLKNEVFPSFSVGLIHGKMKASDKDGVMQGFSSGEIQILVSTTVIEVGVNVPNASLMIIENAERFGLSQLHQLRGRVGRGTRKAYCVLVSDSKGEKARKRLSVMKNTYDGYKIAEYDLRMRGPGDYFPSKNGSARQHGEGENGIMSADMSLLKTVSHYAEQTVALDPELTLPENRYASEVMHKTLFADSRAMQ